MDMLSVDVRCNLLAPVCVLVKRTSLQTGIAFVSCTLGVLLAVVCMECSTAAVDTTLCVSTQLECS